MSGCIIPLLFLEQCFNPYTFWVNKNIFAKKKKKLEQVFKHVRHVNNVRLSVYQFGIELLRRATTVHGHEGLCCRGNTVVVEVELALALAL